MCVNKRHGLVLTCAPSKSFLDGVQRQRLKADTRQEVDGMNGAGQQNTSKPPLMEEKRGNHPGMTKKGKIRNETKPPTGAAKERAGGEENELICQSGQMRGKRDG